MNKPWPLKRLGLKVRNLAKSIDFYETLGFTLIDKTDTEASLGTKDHEILHLRYLKDGVAPSPSTAGLYHFAILLPSEEELGSFLNHAIENKIRLDGASDHIVSQAIYLQDPEGNGIEIYADRPSESWEWEGDKIKMGNRQLDIDRLLSLANSSKKFSEETVLGHMHLSVNDLEESEKFYKEKLGLDIVADMPSAKFLSWDKYHHHIGMNIWKGEKGPKITDKTFGIDFYEIEKEGLKLGTVEDVNGIKIIIK